MFETVFVVGATSSIARELIVRLTAARGSLYLASRDIAEQARIASDLEIRYGFHVFQGHFEAADYSSHAALVDDALASLGRFDCILLATGELGDQVAARQDFDRTRQILDSNFIGLVSLLTHVAGVMEVQTQGQIIVLSSVAGERGRQSNYIYGAAKAGINIFMQGLRNRLYSAGIKVLTVKLGFTDTKMTFGKPDMFMVISPAQAARSITRHVHRGSDEAYVPAFWKLIMFIIRSIPERIFKRLKL